MFAKNYVKIRDGINDISTETFERCPVFFIGELVYVDLPVLVTLATDSNSDKYSNLLHRGNGSSRILQVIKHTHTVDENGIPNTISIDRPTPVNRSISHPYGSKQSSTSLKDKITLSETDCFTKTGITPQRPNDSMKGTELSTANDNCTKISSEYSYDCLKATKLLSKQTIELVLSRRYRIFHYQTIRT